jgi:hypothetical protein
MQVSLAAAALVLLATPGPALAAEPRKFFAPPPPEETAPVVEAAPAPDAVKNTPSVQVPTPVPAPPLQAPIAGVDDGSPGLPSDSDLRVICAREIAEARRDLLRLQAEQSTPPIRGVLLPLGAGLVAGWGLAAAAQRQSK